MKTVLGFTINFLEKPCKVLKFFKLKTLGTVYKVTANWINMWLLERVYSQDLSLEPSVKF